MRPADELRSDRFFHSCRLATGTRKHEATYRKGEKSFSAEKKKRRENTWSGIVGVLHKGPGVARCIVQQPCVLIQEKPRGCQESKSLVLSTFEQGEEWTRRGGERRESVPLTALFMRDVKVDWDGVGGDERKELRVCRPAAA